MSKTRPFLNSLAVGDLAGFPHSNKIRCVSLQLIHCYDLVSFINKASVCWNVVILRMFLLPCTIDVFGAPGGGLKARGEGDRHVTPEEQMRKITPIDWILLCLFRSHTRPSINDQKRCCCNGARYCTAIKMFSLRWSKKGVATYYLVFTSLQSVFGFPYTQEIFEFQCVKTQAKWWCKRQK